MSFELISVIYGSESKCIVGMFSLEFIKSGNFNTFKFRNGMLLTTIIRELSLLIRELKESIDKIRLVQYTNNLNKDYEINKINTFNKDKILLYSCKLYEMEYNFRIMVDLKNKYGMKLKCYRRIIKERCGCFTNNCHQCNFISDKRKKRVMNDYNDPINNQVEIAKRIKFN